MSQHLHLLRRFLTGHWSRKCERSVLGYIEMVSDLVKINNTKGEANLGKENLAGLNLMKKQ